MEGPEGQVPETEMGLEGEKQLIFVKKLADLIEPDSESDCDNDQELTQSDYALADKGLLKLSMWLKRHKDKKIKNLINARNSQKSSLDRLRSNQILKPIIRSNAVPSVEKSPTSLDSYPEIIPQEWPIITSVLGNSPVPVQGRQSAAAFGGGIRTVSRGNSRGTWNTNVTSKTPKLVPQGLVPRSSLVGLPHASVSLALQPRKLGCLNTTSSKAAANYAPESPEVVRPSSPSPKIVQVTIQPDITALLGDTICPPKTSPFTESPKPKTYPSLMVPVRPVLVPQISQKVLSEKRQFLDTTVKQILAKSPQGFLNWTKSAGLVRSSLRCPIHGRPLNRVIASTTGEVLSGDCCNKTLPVYCHSIFDGQSTATVVKLLYHWAVQTKPSDVLQWVQVKDVDLKNFNVWMRATCTAALHELCPPLGGLGTIVEVGIITLHSQGKTEEAGEKSVNVKILGMLDRKTNIIRMRIVNVSRKFDTSNNSIIEPAFGINSFEGSCIFQILLPIGQLVDKQTTLVIDQTLNPNHLQELGFKHVWVQTSNAADSSMNNRRVMDYLKTVLPPMFRTTLCVLSATLVQEFLDELSWREMYAAYPLLAFNALLSHLKMVTQSPGNTEGVVKYLTTISHNPFADWSETKQALRNPSVIFPPALRYRLQSRDFAKFPETSSPRVPRLPEKAKVGRPKLPQIGTSPYYRNNYLSCPKTLVLQTYYYGSAPSKKFAVPGKFPENLKCPSCCRLLRKNSEVVPHLRSHDPSRYKRTPDDHFCKVCLAEVLPNQMETHLKGHQEVPGGCGICNLPFYKHEDLVIHMWDLHHAREAPYKCELCHFSTSFHYSLLEHFAEEHESSSVVICPVCLATFDCSSRRILVSLMYHLQAHVSKGKNAVKCLCCVLSFPSKTAFHRHLVDHLSHDLANWVPYVLPEGEIAVSMGSPPNSLNPLRVTLEASRLPETRKRPIDFHPGQSVKRPKVTVTEPEVLDDHVMVAKYLITVPSTTANCSECGEDIHKSGHFVGRLFCRKCPYQTACQAAMAAHVDNKHRGLIQNKEIGMSVTSTSFEEGLTCLCGFYTKNGCQMAKHLLSCSKKLAVFGKVEVQPTTMSAKPEVAVMD